MKKSTVGVYFTGLIGPWISGINRVLTDSTSFLQSEVAAAQLAEQGATTAQQTSEQFSQQSGQYATASQTSSNTAQNYAEQAQTALAAVQAILKTMNAEWLGSFATDPTTDNNGLPLTDKAIYFNTKSKKVRVYEDGAWIDADQSVQDAMQNAINAAGAASASASASATSATASQSSAETSEYWANLSKQYADTVSAQAIPLTADLAGKYVRINPAGNSYQFDDPTTVLETIKAAPLLSAPLTGIPTAPTAATNTATSQLATCGFVLNQAGSTLPLMSNANGRIGTSFQYARMDHVHPVDRSRASVNGDNTKMFKASVFLASWGTAGSGYSFANDGSFDSGMFSQKEGDVFFMANSVVASEFTTTGWAFNVPVQCGSGLTAQQTLSIANKSAAANTKAMNARWADASSDGTLPDRISYDFGGTTTHYLGSDGSAFFAGDISGNGAFTTSGNISVSGIFEAGGDFPQLTNGFYASWGTVSGSGETDLVNFRGAGSGGFKWYNTTPAEWKNTSDKTNLWLGHLDQAGNFTVKGTVTTTSLAATTAASTLYGVNYRAPLPTISFYIAQSENPVASITVDNNGTYSLRNSDNSSRLVSDFTYSTINFGPNTARSVFSCGIDGSLTYSQSNKLLMSFNPNGFTFKKRINLLSDTTSADINLITTNDTVVRGTSLKLVAGVGVGFIYGSGQSYLDNNGRWISNTVVALSNMVSPAYYAGNNSGGGGYFFQTAQATGLQLGIEDIPSLLLSVNGAVQATFGSGQTTWAAPVTFSKDAAFEGVVGLTGLKAAGESTEIISTATLTAAGNTGTATEQTSPTLNTRTANGVNFSLYANSSTTNGNRGILSLFTGNNWYNYAFSPTAIAYPNGNVGIHSDTTLGGQTINGHLTINQGIDSGGNVQITGTTGGTGTNGSVRPNDVVSGPQFISHLYGSTSTLKAAFAVKDVNGASSSYASTTLTDNTGAVKEWTYDQTGRFSSPGDVSSGAGARVITDRLASSGTKYAGTITVESPLQFINGNQITMLADNNPVVGDANLINKSTMLSQVVSQRNPKFAFNHWAEESVGNYVGGVFQASDGSNTNYFYMLSTGEFRCQYVTSISAKSNYADYAENYRSKTVLEAGAIVKIASDKDHAQYNLDPSDELAPATLRDGKFFAVVSSNPGYTLNSECEYGLPVALAGRVPVQVLGKVQRGDPITVSNVPGVGIVGSELLIGFALESKSTGDIGLIEVALGGKAI